MNLILLFQSDFVNGADRVLLTGRRRDHVRDVHRASVGDELCVGLMNGPVGRGTVTALDNGSLEMNVCLDREAPKALPVTLVLALPRPQMLKRILATVSAMGVKRIILIQSARVEKSFWRSPLLKKDRIREHLVLGLEQARDTVMPDVQTRRLFKPFVEDELPGIVKDTLALVAHPESEEPCPHQTGRPVTLVVGPEGGFVPYEIEQLKQAGLVPVHLGERVLRVESAVPALLARLF